MPIWMVVFMGIRYLSDVKKNVEHNAYISRPRDSVQTGFKKNSFMKPYVKFTL